MKEQQVEYCVVFVTAKDVVEAEKISQELLQKKLAACVNIVSKIKSFFWWKGTIDQEDESFLIIKTRAALLDELTAAVKAAHSYTVPEIIALPILGGNPDYLKWITESTLHN